MFNEIFCTFLADFLCMYCFVRIQSGLHCKCVVLDYIDNDYCFVDIAENVGGTYGKTKTKPSAERAGRK